MATNIIGPVRTGLTPQGRDENNQHKCGKCFGPYGRSAIPCPNRMKEARDGRE